MSGAENDYDRMRASVDAAAAERLKKSLAMIEEAGRAVFLRECAAAGIDPGRGVSPALLKAIGRPPEAGGK